MGLTTPNTLLPFRTSKTSTLCEARTFFFLQGLDSDPGLLPLRTEKGETGIGPSALRAPPLKSYSLFYSIFVPDVFPLKRRHLVFPEREKPFSQRFSPAPPFVGGSPKRWGGGRFESIDPGYPRAFLNMVSNLCSFPPPPHPPLQVGQSRMPPWSLCPSPAPFQGVG